MIMCVSRRASGNCIRPSPLIKIRRPGFGHAVRPKQVKVLAVLMVIFERRREILLSGEQPLCYLRHVSRESEGRRRWLLSNQGCLPTDSEVETELDWNS